MRPNTLRLSLIFSIIIILGLGSSAWAGTELTVSAAISLKDAFTEIGKIFEGKNSGTKVNFNFGASGDLARQIEGGAPVDVFASAALKDMDGIEQKGMVLSATRTNFAANSVVLIAPAESKISLSVITDLAKPEVKKIGIGNPKTVPAGRYADESLGTLGIKDQIKEKLIFAENVRQVLDYVVRGEVDAGFVYLSDTVAKNKGIRVVATTPAESHKPILYPIAVIKGTKSEPVAQAFIALVVSAEGKRILERYGFQPTAKK